ncbi:hypothetical protein F511_41933 [Dorcoceras hygrometricum]|uniref:Uncharacterized protein n=1 Tax=Dorcoceras hygrometricum TaxID=472368 RepID=A0A2Z7D458_9LAMI|nr:hypothetical protein F511_41933 [Dorcoceras hygrometricum]
MKQLVCKHVKNSGVESAVEEVNEPDVVVHLLIYQMFINRGESAVGTTNSKTADEIYKEEPTADERYEENQQLSEQLLNNLLSQSIVVEEDSGEAIDEPDASNSSIQSRAYMNQLLLLNQSLALHPVAKIQTQENNNRSAKQNMQSAVARIHQLQAISCCKQKSRPAVDTTDGSAGVARPAGAQRMISWKQMRAVSWKQMRAVSCKQMSTRSNAKEESESDVEQLIQMLD